MKILQLCNKAPYPANDGSSIAICSLAEGLADNGAELHLMPVNTKKHFKPEENIPAAFKTKTHYRSVFKNTNTSPLGALLNLLSSQSYFVSRFFFSEYEGQLVKKLKGNNFDVVIIDGVFMASYIPVIRQHSKAKIVLRTHNVEHQIWERHLAIEKNPLKKAYLSLQNKRLKTFEVNAFNLADAIATITDEDKKNIASIVPGKPIVTCLTGIDLERYTFTSPVAKPGTVFHFASMDWMPNIEAVDWLMNEVWPAVEKKLPGTTLVLAGRGMPERFRNMAGNNITVITDVESSADFYATYDLMLVPLWSGSGLRIKLVEGFAYGKAIITTSIGAEGIPYRQGHDVLIADTAGDFAAAIVTLLSDAVYKERLEQNARALAETHFNYKTIAAGLLSFFKTL
jgi:glycosyltransferase involved in cell wall biosynthesis